MSSSSTAALFGNPERSPIEEDDPLRPTNVYGESKLMVERMLAWLNGVHGLRYASLRYFNAAGAVSADHGEDHRPESHLIPLARLESRPGSNRTRQRLRRRLSDPRRTCVRDYIHVLDLASAHLLALDALERHDRLIYNLGNGQGFSVREVIEVAQGHRASHPRGRVAAPSGRSGDSDRQRARIRRELNWRPQFPDLRPSSPARGNGIALIPTAWRLSGLFKSGLSLA